MREEASEGLPSELLSETENGKMLTCKNRALLRFFQILQVVLLNSAFLRNKLLHKRKRRKLITLTVGNVFASHVVACREAVFCHRHVGVKGERQETRGGHDLRRDLHATISPNKW